MALVHYSIPSLIGGVSQQPPAQRFRGQAQAQENALSSPVDGLVKRYPTQHIARIIDPAPASAFVHTIDRDAVERYVVTISGGTLQVFGLDGTEYGVYATASGGAADFSYLSSTASDHRALTINDFTFVLNTAQTTAEIPIFPPTPSEDAFLFVRQGAVSTRYVVTLERGVNSDRFFAATWNGTGATAFCEDAEGHTMAICNANGGTWNTDVNEQVQSIATTDIADKLRQKLDADGNITATRSGSVVRIQPTGAGDNADFDDVRVEDDLGDSALIKVHKEIPLVSDLPLTCLDGYRVKVTQDAGESLDPVDDYYLKFVADEAGEFTNGHWEETDDGIGNVEIDGSTMPHQLIRRQDDGLGTVTGTPNAIFFSFEEVDWTDRTVGDSTTNPAPTFIGKTIKDVFFYRGRLGFLTDQDVVLSEVGQFFNFWRTSISAGLLDSDPISVSSNTTRVSILNHAVPLAERLIVFSDRTQFVLADQPTLTPSTAALRPVLDYENFEDAAPAPAGPSLLFGIPQGSFSGVREMISVDQDELFQADQVTAAVSKYIPGTITQISASTLENLALIRADGDTDALYVYSYLWGGREKIQSSWSRWTFDGEILSADWIRSTVYLVVKRSDGLYLESMDIGAGLADTNSVFVTRLDRRVDSADLAAGVYDETLDRTSYTLPYDAPSDIQAVRQATVSAEAGVPQAVDSTDGTTLRLRGDTTALALWFGIPYTMEFEFTPPLVKEPRGQGEAVVSNATFLMRTLTVEYAETGYFAVEYTPPDLPTYTEEFTQQVLGVNIVLGTVNVFDGKATSFITGVADPRTSIKITSDSPLPCRLLSAEVEGEQDQRSQRT